MNTSQAQIKTNIDRDLQLVKEQITYHERQANAVPEAYKAKRHVETAQRYRTLAANYHTLLVMIEDAECRIKELEALAPKFRPKQLSLALTQEDIAGLPDELIKELSLKTNDRTEFAIVSILDEAGGILSLDKLLIGLFRKTGEIHKRQALVQRLYRMSEKGLAFPVPGKKGVYSRLELTEHDAEQIFSKDPKDSLGVTSGEAKTT